MRQIKFRGLSINGKDWHIGNLSIIDTDLNQTVKRGYYISNSIGMPLAYQIRPETVGQFTGLLDKNGKEIYEWDILKNTKENIIVSVIWDVSGAGWQFNEYIDFDDGVGRGDWRLTIGFAKNCEVIGNIYENPNLLTQAQLG
jgi:uncharacterized phage protein (TIGR01671 family)